MTIMTAPVGYVAAYTPANAKAVPFGEGINPHKDSIFIDPRTGELTTIKPGIYDPNAKKKSKTGLVALGAALTAAVLAFVFRGKIAKIPFVQKNILPLVETAKKWVGTKWTAIKNAKIVKTVLDGAKNGFEAVKKYAGKAWDAVKNLFTKAPAKP